jgi:hypothetical protein
VKSLRMPPLRQLSFKGNWVDSSTVAPGTKSADRFCFLRAILVGESAIYPAYVCPVRFVIP